MRMLISLQDTPALRLHADDDVAVALVPLPAGRQIAAGEPSVRLTANIDPGHKIALRAVATGQPVRRYGQVIGFATRSIAPGDHVHTHNLAVGDMQLDYQYGTDVREVVPTPDAERRTFMGYRRAIGRAGTRK